MSDSLSDLERDRSLGRFGDEDSLLCYERKVVVERLDPPSLCFSSEICSEKSREQPIGDPEVVRKGYTRRIASRDFLEISAIVPAAFVFVERPNRTSFCALPWLPAYLPHLALPYAWSSDREQSGLRRIILERASARARVDPGFTGGVAQILFRRVPPH